MKIGEGRVGGGCFQRFLFEFSPQGQLLRWSATRYEPFAGFKALDQGPTPLLPTRLRLPPAFIHFPWVMAAGVFRGLCVDCPYPVRPDSWERSWQSAPADVFHPPMLRITHLIRRHQRSTAARVIQAKPLGAKQLITGFCGFFHHRRYQRERRSHYRTKNRDISRSVVTTKATKSWHTQPTEKTPWPITVQQTADVFPGSPPLNLVIQSQILPR